MEEVVIIVIFLLFEIHEKDEMEELLIKINYFNLILVTSSS